LEHHARNAPPSAAARDVGVGRHVDEALTKAVRAPCRVALEPWHGIDREVGSRAASAQKKERICAASGAAD
jgi:hypothetical protein